MHLRRRLAVGLVLVGTLHAPAARAGAPTSGSEPTASTSAATEEPVDNHASRPPPGLEAAQPEPPAPTEVRGTAVERPPAPAPPVAPRDERSMVSRGLPQQLDLSLGWVAGNVGLSLLLLLLLVGAAQLFNDTIRANHDDLARRLRAVSERLAALERLSGAGGVAPQLVGFVAVAGAVGLLADPDVSLSTRTAAQMVGMSAAFACLVLVYDGLAARAVARSSGLRFRYQLYPLGLAVAVGSMLVSRIFHVAPGVVYGLVAGFVFAAPVAGRQEGAAYARATAVTYATVIVAFVLHREITGPGVAGSGFASIALDTATAAVCVGGLQSAVVQLLPMRFVNGEKVAEWSRIAWFGLLVLGLTLYLQLVVRPAPGSASWESVWFGAALVVAAVGLWGMYHVKERREERRGPTGQGRSDELAAAG